KVRSAAGMLSLGAAGSLVVWARKSVAGAAGNRFIENCPSAGAGLYVRMKKVKSWNAMSSIGVIGTSIVFSSRFFILRRLNGAPPVWLGIRSIRLDPPHPAFIAFKANLWKPLAWQAVMR